MQYAAAYPAHALRLHNLAYLAAAQVALGAPSVWRWPCCACCSCCTPLHLRWQCCARAGAAGFAAGLRPRARPGAAGLLIFIIQQQAVLAVLAGKRRGRPLLRLGGRGRGRASAAWHARQQVLRKAPRLC